jgi:hypothetical protein
MIDQFSSEIEGFWTVIAIEILDFQMDGVFVSGMD